MTEDKKIYNKLSDAAADTADPGRAERNLIRFIENNSGYRRLVPHLSIVARLFADSQFLANFCFTNAEELFAALKERLKSISRGLLKERASTELEHEEELDVDSMMRELRKFKKRYMVRITLRDLSGETSITSSMDELTFLAEVITEIALQWSLRFNQRRYGEPSENSIAIIGLGKLGGEELNYSSDIDLIAVYDREEGETSGVLNPSGIMFNRISNHEFYCKVMELFSRLLSANTEDGIAYRVDVRLRPQGQKGDIAMPIRAYQTYYESWGRTWERMVLIRARPVAGDMNLGGKFLSTIEPFVWKKTIDYAEIEEIRGLKKKIDSTFTRDDIKRGYGGIREAEFFVQTFQLLYAGENKSLKSYRILNAIQALKWMKMVPEKDLTVLWSSYLYLRRVEHYLQMKEDLQTHTLPSSDDELDVLSRKMGFEQREDFLADLRIKRMQIKNMYNSLLGTQEDVHAEALNLLEGKLNDKELTGYLSFRRVKYPDKCLVNLKNIREQLAAFRTIQERTITREVIPLLLENALTAESPDRVLSGLEKLLTTYGIKTVHMTALKGQSELMKGIIKLFSLSPYLTGIFLSDHYYLDILIEEWSILKSLKKIEERLGRAVKRERDFSSVIAEFRRFEEIRIGILFLLNILKIKDLFRGLSHLAEAIIKAVVDKFKTEGLSVIALGKLGGREMTFGSDLDIVFVSQTPEAITVAERIVKTLTAYSDRGLVYSVDTRLRPDGSKGILVKDIEGYRDYYLKKAQNWEIQTLLKARPAGGDEKLARLFIAMAKDVILQKGSGVERADITAMREKIMKELSQESRGIDIKLGPGGIEEIEFFVQYLQLNHSKRHPEILVQSTALAIDRLAKIDVISASDRDVLKNAYEYFRKLETFLRLNEEQLMTAGSDVAGLSAQFMGYRTEEEFLEHIRTLRENVLEVINVN
jgi:glutamate-ammonia-ligase adenylyltransferase